MIKKIFSTLLKFKIINILNIQNSYFKIVKMKKKISKEVILLNYSDLSPYKDFNLVYNLENNKINLWFTNQEKLSIITLPESYILSKHLIKKKLTGIILFNSTPKKLILIQDSQLKYQLSMEHISKYQINLLKQEFSISNFYQYSEDEYNNIFNDSIETLSIVDIFQFLSIELDYREILNIFIKKLAIPIGVFVLLLLSLESINYLYLKDKLTLVKSNYSTIREKSSLLRDKIKQIENQQDKYKLLEKELDTNTKFINITTETSKILKENNSSFIFLRISDSEFRIKIDTNQTAKVFSDIVNSNYLEDLRIQSTKKNRYTNRESVIITGKTQ